MLDIPAGTDLGGGHRKLPDVVCSGLCGAGGFVPRPSAFLADTAVKATAERRFLPPPAQIWRPGHQPRRPHGSLPQPGPRTTPPRPSPRPPAPSSSGNTVLNYASGTRRTPRAPEALHWLIHIGHYGQSHNHSGKRAFLLLKSPLPQTVHGPSRTSLLRLNHGPTCSSCATAPIPACSAPSSSRSTARRRPKSARRPDRVRGPGGRAYHHRPHALAALAACRPHRGR